MRLFSVIGEAVQTIQSNESQRKRLAEQLVFLREQGLKELNSTEAPENQFIIPIQPSALNCRVCGGDSGFVSKSLHSIDLVLVRTVGVLFEYQNGIVTKTKYWPNFFDFPQPFLSNHALDLDELNTSKSLLRLKEEIKMAKQMIESEKPDFCLLDGSLVPQYMDKPRKDSKLAEEYHGLLDLFLELYQTAEQNNTELVGCVEDSRGSRFQSILGETILPFFKKQKPLGLDFILDSVLLDHVLQKNERSFAFPYTKSIKDHAILQDFGLDWGNRLFACYLKPSELDRPLRIEFLHSPKKGSLTEHTNCIASTIGALSGLHREYAYPSVLIEADLRAHLKPEEIDVVFNKICDQLSKRVRMQLRRNSRPF
ncbi:DNA double-strand break repair nuclease NurA [Candidatus Micrarchaeota archaeon]|nr:DNA double-strand break repair nuclease NurA [Candidatus Micrarchaeota archaeon]MBU1930547.1 DNA double-strand break repair nuclease NurA [Candidatus Micrarchaeota archaeon]